MAKLFACKHFCKFNMTHIAKMELYDEMCYLLTDYECEIGQVSAEDLYEMLVKIQNNWEELIGDDE